MSNDDEVNDEIGYKKPPKATQFKKGRSGNPSGRPKNVPKKPLQIFAGILNEKITVREGDKTKRISKLEGLFHTAIMKAMKGDARAFNNIISLFRMSGIIAPEAKDDRPQGGVLLLAPPATSEEWEKMAEKYRKETLELDGNFRKDVTLIP